MKFLAHIYPVVCLFLGLACSAQSVTFRENGKWGIKESGNVVIQPLYDTIFNFDSTGAVCMACHRTRSASANKFIKVTTTSYACHYLNKKAERLIIRNQLNDTFSVFSFHKQAVKQFSGNSPFFTVMVKGKKHILYKNFQQLTFKGYHEISFSPEKDLYLTSEMNAVDMVVCGVTNAREEIVIPHQYSTVKINTSDSLIIACTAGVRNNAEDEVFDYTGKKITGSRRHIDMATKHFLIHKFYEPKEYYLLYNQETKEEKNLNADEIRIYEHDELLIRIRNDWFIYDLNTNQKRPHKPS